MADEIYHVALGVTGAGKVMATSDGMTEDVHDCLNSFDHTLTLRLGAGPSELKPDWVTLAGALGALPTEPFYEIALASKAVVSGTGMAINVAAAKAGDLVNALQDGGSLVVTLKKKPVGASVPSPPPPSWRDVAAALAKLTDVVYVAEMTCVGPRPPGP